MKWLLLLLIPILSVKAETIPLPSSVLGVDDIIEEFRGQLSTKFNDLGKNYITRIVDQSVSFLSTNPYSCNGVVNNPNAVLTTLQYFYKKTDTELVEKSKYTGCNGEISLVEDVVTRGTNLNPLKFSDFIRGKRSFDLADGENYRLYQATNSDGEEIFKVLIQKNNNSKLVQFFITGQKFLTMNYDYAQDSTRLTLTFYGFNVTYARKYASWNMKMDFTPYKSTVYVSKNSGNQAVYLDNDGKQISLLNFLNGFTNQIMNTPIKLLYGIFAYHNYYFPETQATQTGAQSQKMLEELRIAQNRLLTNTELNLVKMLLQDYINALEKGLIIDNRPKQ